MYADDTVLISPSARGMQCCILLHKKYGMCSSNNDKAIAGEIYFRSDAILVSSQLISTALLSSYPLSTASSCLSVHAHNVDHR